MATTSRLLLGVLCAAGLSAGMLPAGNAAPAPEPARSARVAPDASALSASTPASTGVRSLFRVTTSKPVFFITIDDGWTAQRSAADYVAARHLPVTVFLTEQAVQGRWSYYRTMARYDAVQNHTMTHKALTAVSSSTRRNEICQAQKAYRAHFGTRPWMLRPPYGSGYMPRRSSTPAIEDAAAACGIKYVVLWNVTVSAGGSMEFANAPFRRGDIVLLHFTGDIKANLAKVVRLYAQHGLRPAPLSRFLTR